MYSDLLCAVVGGNLSESAITPAIRYLNRFNQWSTSRYSTAATAVSDDGAASAVTASAVTVAASVALLLLPLLSLPLWLPLLVSMLLKASAVDRLRASSIQVLSLLRETDWQICETGEMPIPLAMPICAVMLIWWHCPPPCFNVSGGTARLPVSVSRRI